MDAEVNAMHPQNWPGMAESMAGFPFPALKPTRYVVVCSRLLPFSIVVGCDCCRLFHLDALSPVLRSLAMNMMQRAQWKAYRVLT